MFVAPAPRDALLCPRRALSEGWALAVSACVDILDFFGQMDALPAEAGTPYLLWWPLVSVAPEERNRFDIAGSFSYNSGAAIDAEQGFL